MVQGKGIRYGSSVYVHALVGYTCLASVPGLSVQDCQPTHLRQFLIVVPKGYALVSNFHIVE